MCLSVTDVGVAVTNLWVVYKIITCVSAFTFTELEMAIILLIIFLEIVKSAAKLLLQVWTLCVAGYSKDAIVRAYNRTSDGQEHKIIWRAGRERFFTYVAQCAKSKAATVTISLGSFTVAGDFVLQLIRLESLGSKLEES